MKDIITKRDVRDLEQFVCEYVGASVKLPNIYSPKRLRRKPMREQMKYGKKFKR
jgi:hypothetical protein